MKKTKTLAIILSVFVIGAIIAGCSSPDSSEVSSNDSGVTSEGSAGETVNQVTDELSFEEKLLGDWEVISLESDKNDLDYAMWQEQMPEGSGIEFTEDALFLKALTIKMDYKIEGTKLFLKQPTVEEYDPKYIEVTVDDDTMVWDCSGVMVNFTRAK